MDKATRLQYLEAMGIAVWVSRHPPITVQTPQVTDAGEFKNVGWADDCRDAGGIPSRAQGVMPGRQIAPAFAEYGTSCTSAIAEQSEAHRSHHDEASETDERRASCPEAQATHASHANEQTWKDLQHQVSLCRACSLCETRTQTVFGVGNKQATWMLIGEAPGQNEDLQGEPFVGKAGQLLTEMLRAIGLKREEVYIANMLKCRPPNNRDPESEEVAACNRFLQRQIELLQPKIILAVGRIAAQNLLKTQQPLAKLRGVRHQLDGIPLIVIHHPAYLLRSLLEKAKAWSDLQFALSVYKNLEK